LSFKTALLLERYEKRGLGGGGGDLVDEAAKRRPTFGKTEDPAFRQGCFTAKRVILIVIKSEHC
jgi:hypothetical protein